MSPRPPSTHIVVDANILISAVLGRRTRDSVSIVAANRSLLTSAASKTEFLATLRTVAPASEERLAAADKLLAFVHVEPGADTEISGVQAAEGVLRNAPASRNGSASDAHLLALAWRYDADIWSHDRDFAGSGWPSWSSANLVAALAANAG